MDRYKKSIQYLERSRQFTPGSAQTLSKMPARFPSGAFPVAVKEGFGARVTDVDDNLYVDWIGALGAVPLGYAHHHVGMAASMQVGCGAYSLPHFLELQLAERLCEKIPCAEMVRFVNSGSEATEAAIRTARIATSRDIILTVKDGYHSWHSWFQAVKPWHPGVPDPYADMVYGFRYNDLDSLGHAFKYADSNKDRSCYGKGVAAVIMEPCLFEEPNADYLFCVQQMCKQAGALLIFDEMVTGYRWALAGGQEYFNVIPDLATFGKGMANGLPIGMLCGKREYMQHAELISGTFGGNAVSLAAANAVLDVYEQEPVIQTMWRRGSQFQTHFNNLVYLRKMKGMAACGGYSCKPRIQFTCGDNSERAMSLFLQVTAELGILLHPGGLNVCYALTDEDMQKTQMAFAGGLEAVQKAIESNDWSALKGDIIRPVVTVRK